MPNRKTRPKKQQKNTLGEYLFCLFLAAALLLVGIAGIHGGSLRVGGTRHVPGRLVYGEEALTVALGYIGGATLLVLWLCRHRPWLSRAIGAALIGNVILWIMVFSRHY